MNPLIAVFYAVLYGVFRHQTDWMPMASGTGRFILFCLHWLAMFLIARQMRASVPPLAFAGFLFAVPVLPLLLVNSSDASFSALSSLAFWKTLQFVQSDRPRDLWQAACLVALSAFCRNDGTVLAVCLAAIAAWRAARGGLDAKPTSTGARGVWRRVASSVAIGFAPVLGLIAVYTLVHFAITHDIRPGSRSRTYIAFEQGQYAAYASTGRYPGGMNQAMRDCDRLYGTMEENHRSVLTAIARNPRAWGGASFRTRG
jgi:hypothetical protein